MDAEVEIVLHAGRVAAPGSSRRRRRGRAGAAGSRTWRHGRRRPPPARRHASTLPAWLPCLSTSSERSTPGPLPYQSANTPSYLAPGNSPTCCEPQTAVAARSSLMPGLEDDAALLQELARLPQRLVQPAQRRAAIAGDEARGVQPGGEVALALQHRQPDQRLDAGHQHPPALQRVAIVEAHLRQRHVPPSPCMHRLGCGFGPGGVKRGRSSGTCAIEGFRDQVSRRP